MKNPVPRKIFIAEKESVDDTGKFEAPSRKIFPLN